MSGRVRFALYLTGAFLLVEAVLLLSHELGTDEIAPWLVATRCESLSEMLHFNWNEDQPRLCHIILYGLGCISSSPLSMQFLNWLTVGAIVYIFARYAPFARVQKILFAFGHLILYEYGAYSRGYSYNMLLLFIFCCMFRERRKKFLYMCGILFLLANLSVDGLIISAASGMALAIEQFRSHGTNPLPTKRAVAGFYIIFIGCFIAAIQCVLPGGALHHDVNYARGLLDMQRIVTALGTVTHGFVPLQFLRPDFWGNLVLDTYPRYVTSGIGALLILYGVLLFMNTPTTFRIWFFSTLGMELFFAMLLPRRAHLRHYGFYYFVFLSAMWMMRQEDCRLPAMYWIRKLTAYVRSRADRVLYILLCIQILCVIYPVYAEIRYPYSSGRDAARWIRDTGRKDWLLVGFWKNSAACIVEYLGKGLYSPACDEVLPIPLLLHGKAFDDEDIPRQEIMKKFPGIKERYGPEVLFIINDYPLDEALVRQYGLIELARFDQAIFRYEKFFIYTFKTEPKSQSSAQPVRSTGT
jgi:hypothetical protein